MLFLESGFDVVIGVTMRMTQKSHIKSHMGSQSVYILCGFLLSRLNKINPDMPKKWIWAVSLSMTSSYQSFFGEMPVFTILKCMIPVNTCQGETSWLNFETIFPERYRGLITASSHGAVSTTWKSMALCLVLEEHSVTCLGWHWVRGSEEGGLIQVPWGSNQQKNWACT